MKKTILTITAGLILLATNSHAFYNSNSQFEDSTETTAYDQMQNRILFKCGQNATEYSNLTGTSLEKNMYYALTKCRHILETYKIIPDGMMPYEDELTSLKKKREIQEKKNLEKNINKGTIGSKELDWENN